MQVHCLSLVDSLLLFWERGDRKAVEAHFNDKVRDLERDGFRRTLAESGEWCLRAYFALWNGSSRISLLNLHHCDFPKKVVTYRLDGTVLTVSDLEARRSALETLWEEPVEFVDFTNSGETFAHSRAGKRLGEDVQPGEVMVRPREWKPYLTVSPPRPIQLPDRFIVPPGQNQMEALDKGLLGYWDMEPRERDQLATRVQEYIRHMIGAGTAPTLGSVSSWCLRAYVLAWRSHLVGASLPLLNLEQCNFKERVVTYRDPGRRLTVDAFERCRDAFEELWQARVRFCAGEEPQSYSWGGQNINFAAPGAVTVRRHEVPYSALLTTLPAVNRYRKTKEFLDWFARGDDPSNVVPEFEFFMAGGEYILRHYWTLSDQDKARGRRFVWRAIAEYAERLNSTTYPAMAAAVAAWRCRLTGSLETSWIELKACDFRNAVVTYVGIGQVLRPADFEPHRDYFETLWQGPVDFLDAGKGVTLPVHGNQVFRHPGCVTVRRRRVLPERIQLGPVRNAEVTFGVELATGERVTLPLRRVPHTLVAGTTGFGKSVFLHQLIQQLLQQTDVERLYLVDLKAGIEFARYEVRPKATVVWEMPEVFRVIDELAAEMDRRLQAARGAGREFNGPRIFFVVDEYAEIELWPSVGKEEKEAKARALAQLIRISLRGRAAGIVLVLSLQKATTDVMDSSLRNNLAGLVCFRVGSKMTAAAMFGSTDDLRVNPLQLRRGQFIFYNPVAAEIQYLQATVPDGLGIADGKG